MPAKLLPVKLFSALLLGLLWGALVLLEPTPAPATSLVTLHSFNPAPD